MHSARLTIKTGRGAKTMAGSRSNLPTLRASSTIPEPPLEHALVDGVIDIRALAFVDGPTLLEDQEQEEYSRPERDFTKLHSSVL